MTRANHQEVAAPTVNPRLGDCDSAPRRLRISQTQRAPQAILAGTPARIDPVADSFVQGDSQSRSAGSQSATRVEPRARWHAHLPDMVAITFSHQFCSAAALAGCHVSYFTAHISRCYLQREGTFSTFYTSSWTLCASPRAPPSQTRSRPAQGSHGSRLVRVASPYLSSRRMPSDCESPRQKRCF